MIDSDVRATFAAIALAHDADRAVSGLFDHGLNRQVKITAVFEGRTLNALDLDRKARVTGELPDFYDFNRSSHIHLAGEGGKYTGYDHKTGTHVYLTVSGETASVYDHDAASWSQFSLRRPDQLAVF